MFVLAWAALLGWIGVAGWLSRRLTRRTRVALSGLVALAAVGLGGLGLLVTAVQVPPWLEARSWWVPEQVGGVTLGIAADNHVVLDDPYTAPWHGRVRWQDGEPLLRNTAPGHRIEVDGVDMNWVPLEAGTGLRLGDERQHVQSISDWPSVSMEDKTELRASVLDALLLHLPLFGERYEARLAVAHERRGLTWERRPTRDPGGPDIVITARGDGLWLGHPTAEDRAAAALLVDQPSVSAQRLADREVALVDGMELTLGYTRYVVQRTDAGLRLEVLSDGRRHTLPRDAALVTFGEPAADGALDLPSALDPPPRLYLVPRLDGGRDVTVAAPGYAVTRLETGLAVVPTQAVPLAAPLPWMPGETLTLTDGEGRGLSLLWSGAFQPLSPGFGAHDPFARTWMMWGIAGAVWVVLSMLLAASGHARGSGFAFLHLVGVQAAVGLVVLFQLTAHVDSVRLPDVAGRHGALLAVSAGLGLALWGLGRIWPEQEGFWEHPLLPVRWVSQLPRAWALWLAAMALLVFQLPFGESGIAVPGLSLQPVEAVKVLLLVFLAWYTARAREDKVRRLRDGRREGLALRWRYKVHALPLVLVAALSMVLDDLSPMLMLGALVAAFYVVSWVRPEDRWRQFWDAWWFEGAVWAGLAAGLLWAVSGTWSSAARRVLVWADPWRHTATASQVVKGWWALRDGGWWGTGLGTAPVALPPAVQDDFILVVLGHQLGAVGLGLWLASWAGLLWAGWRAVTRLSGRTAAERRRVLYGLGGLCLLGLQVAVNGGSVSGLLPVMGQPLPFMSAGGSHLMLCCVPTVALVLYAARRPRTRGGAAAAEPDWQPAPLTRRAS